MKTIISALLCLLPLLASADSQPATYTIQGKHNLMHLVGTANRLQRTDELPTNIRRAYTDSKQLLMEVDTRSSRLGTLNATILSTGILGKGDDLEGKLDSLTYARVRVAALESKIDMAVLSHMRPWLVAVFLNDVILSHLGYFPESGIENQLTKLANSDGKTINGLETIEGQYNLFANMDKDTEKDFLVSTLDRRRYLQTEMAELRIAWQQGDETKLLALMLKDIKGHEKLYNILLTERNKSWLSQLEKLLNGSTDNYLIAVSALHLVGDDGLVSLLRKAGYEVARD